MWHAVSRFRVLKRTLGRMKGSAGQHYAPLTHIDSRQLSIRCDRRTASRDETREALIFRIPLPQIL
jgi:hypothetical protein